MAMAYGYTGPIAERMACAIPGRDTGLCRGRYAMTDTQGWILIIEVGIVALYYLLALIGVKRG